MMMDEGEEKEAKLDAWVQTIEKEIEPLLKDAKPFFGVRSSTSYLHPLLP